MASNVMRGRPIGVEINGQMVCITDWSLKRAIEEQEVTNSCSEGDDAEWIASGKNADGTFKGYWVLGKDYHDDATFDIEPGNYVDAKFLFQKTNPVFYAAEILIKEWTTSGSIKTQMNFDVAFRVNGPITNPIIPAAP